MDNTSPKLVGVEATFWHVDDIDWTPVQKQRNADGSVSAVREKWPIMRPDFLSAYVHYDPGMVVRRHGHRSNHIVFVLDGGASIGGDWCTAGTHIHVPLGATFGPIIAGPEGVTCWELSFGEFGGWGDEQALYDREIETRGVTPLPDPPLDLGDWFKDPRGDVGAERGTPRVPGLVESVTTMDDFEWTVVKRQRNADGSVSVIREKWPIAQPDFMTAYIEYDPGMITAPPWALRSSPRVGHRGRRLVRRSLVSSRHPHRAPIRCRLRPDHRGQRGHPLPRNHQRRLPRLGRPTRDLRRGRRRTWGHAFARPAR